MLTGTQMQQWCYSVPFSLQIHSSLLMLPMCWQKMTGSLAHRHRADTTLSTASSWPTTRSFSTGPCRQTQQHNTSTATQPVNKGIIIKDTPARLTGTLSPVLTLHVFAKAARAVGSRSSNLKASKQYLAAGNTMQQCTHVENTWLHTMQWTDKHCQCCCQICCRTLHQGAAGLICLPGAQAWSSHPL